MHSSLPVSLAAMAFASFASAQDFIGFSYNAQVGATSRGTMANNAGQIMTRIDGDEYAGWGTDTPGFRTISSIYMVIQDQNAIATVETFDVFVYPESTTLPGFPDLTGGILFAAAVPGPPNTATITAAARTLTPAAPVAVPIQGGGDIFIAFALPSTVGWPSDGLSSHIVLGYQPSPTFLVYDIPGQAQTPFASPSPANSHGLSVPVSTGIASYDTRRNWLIDIEHSTAAGVVMGITNQASLLGSANPPPAGFGPAPGTADFMSGVSPDVSQFDPLRADDVTMDYYRTGSNTPLVFFLYDIGAFGPELPLAGFVPGSTGVACINAGSFISAGLAIGSANEAFRVSAFPVTPVRLGLVGFPLIQQAIEFDTATGVAHGSPCGRQIF